ncbi:MAG: MMPL family transporter, partial [Gammaproteobacteria bacterium]|nr:MMPL family transporter [Gammaproteobacteria bacterium]
AVSQFQINSDLSQLIHQEAGWREDFEAYKEKFPDLVDPAIVVVSGASFMAVENAARRLEASIAAREEYFRAVYSPQNDPFFRRHALLYLPLDDLYDMTDRLAQAQPMLTAVSEDPSLRSILKLLREGVANGETDAAGFATTVRLLTQSAQAHSAGEDSTIRWTDEFFSGQDTWHRLILLKGQRNFSATLPNAAVMQELRLIIDAMDFPAEISVGITGEVALSHEEIEAAMAGVQLAGWVAVVLLFAILFLGVRSLKIIAATFAMLVIGIIWTSAYAMLAVGEYNTLSIIFLVMFFGLGVDFAIHFSLRYQEAVNVSDDAAVQALQDSAGSVGGAIVICTVTTALGFLGFWPTDYQGLADLGVISAGGMLVAAFLTFTFLPAFYAAVGSIRPHVIDIPTSDRLVGWLIRRRVGVIAAIAIAALGAIFSASQAKFDYSVLALKDPDAQSMRTLRELQAGNIATDYSLNILSQRQIPKAELEALVTVDSVTTPFDYVPADQADKLFVLQDLEQLLFSAIAPVRSADAPSAIELRAEITALIEAIRMAPASLELERLALGLEQLLRAEGQVLADWQQPSISVLLKELAWLREAIYVETVEFDDLPRRLRARLVSDDGDFLSVVVPAENVAPVAALSRFIESVREVVPIATGRPVIEWGVGGIVVSSFQQALAFALVSILLVLLVTFRNVRDAVLILIPLALAALFTLAIGVLLGVSLNMANILVLPLVFGLGVDNGIHVVDRFQATGDVENFLHSSTPRAVMLSTLTTVGTFAALSLSPHQGTASIGILLTIAVALVLVFTVFLLPVLLSFSSPTHHATV